MVSVSFNPVGSWWVVAAFAVIVTALTVWAYLPRLRGTTGSWRWLALALRLAAVLLCFLASVRPSVVFQEKKKQPTTLDILIDDSTSMKFTDEVSGQRRWDVARQVMARAREVAEGLGDGVTVKTYRFNSDLRDDATDAPAEPTGRETAIGKAMLEAVRREKGSRLSSLVILSDGANNSGVAPLIAARQLKGQQIPVVTVGFGSEQAGDGSRDVVLRDVVAGPTVYVKNQLQIKGNVLARGFANQTLDLEMYVEGQDGPVATKRLRVPENADLIPITGLTYVPQTAGEKKVTFTVKPKEGELVASNNSVSTFISVLKGGVSVLFLQGPHFTWEYKYLVRALDASPDIQADLRVVRTPARRSEGELSDDLFTRGRYDVYILSDLPADHLSPAQAALLARAVENGVGLIMLGGRSSFGAGGWANTEVERVLPVAMSPRDGQFEPEGGVRFVPNSRGLESYLIQVAPTPAESRKVWELLPPLSGINRLGQLKPTATVFGQTEGNRPEPIMVGAEAGGGRTLVFGGETWVWARSTDQGRLAHMKFWRQAIFWLAHKEDQGENEVKIALDSRRISTGQKLDFTATARDGKGNRISDVQYEARIESAGDEPSKYAEQPPMFSKGDESRGTFIASKAPPGDYRLTVTATRDGREIGRDSARFLVYEDDRELENPAADRSLLRQIAEASGGEFLAPEQLTRYLQSLRGKLFTESVSQTERKIWDNWPFLLLFATLLTLEWWLRKRHGWV
jgi:uncharacterized membrane protein